MATSLLDQIERARHELLDLTARNRLLNTPLGRGRSTRLDIVDELSSETFRLLVQERKDMSFLPTEEPVSSESESEMSEQGHKYISSGASTDDEGQLQLLQPVEMDSDGSVADRHIDHQLQTALIDDKLQTRLLRLFYDARSMSEEQGVNSLFLALGFLEWYESPTSDKVRYAPLLLIPVELHRRTVNARFRLRFLDEEITTNLSLQAKLKADLGLQMPDVPDVEDLIPADYFAAIEAVVSDQPRWQVHANSMTLWFFSFAKFLMFRDLDPDVWPEGKGPSEHPLVRGLLGEPMAVEPPLIGEDERLDERLDPRTTCHVMDADSSQAAAIEEVRSGRNLVIQGPPGTGKSQSITNVIAAAVRDGRTVLFVAEKLAALEVVNSRLDRVGLGDVCLELHSHKANRRAVLDDLDRTLSLGKPKGANVESQAAELARTRDRLNEYARQLHESVSPSGRTPYELIGTLCRLQSRGTRAFDGELSGLESWSTTMLQEKQGLLRDLAEHLSELGSPEQHAWRGVRRVEPLLPTDQQAIQQQLNVLCESLEQICKHATQLARLLHVTWDDERESFQSVQRLAQLAAKLRSIPPMDREAFADPVWEKERDGIDRVVARGHELAECRQALSGIMAPVAWQTSVAQIRVDLAATGTSIFRWFSGRWRAAKGTLRGIVEQQLPKTLETQLWYLDTLMRGQSCVQDLNGTGTLRRVGQAAFGTHWQDTDSDWDALAAIANWEAECRSSDVPRVFRRMVGRWTDTAGTDTAYAALRDIFRQAWESLRKLLQELNVETATTFGSNVLIEVPLADIRDRLSQWRDATSTLGRWIVFQRRLCELDEAGLGSLLAEINKGEIDERSIDRLELAYCETAMRGVLAERDTIARFDGVSQARLVDDFRRLDQEGIVLARREVAARHYDGLPAGGEFGELGILRGEIRKKRRHRSLRRLLGDAGRAVQAIKPVFMMSPISVAQFLEPGALSFDLLVIDEASQVRPVESLGAVMRCRQATVVGDNRQLPPTAFFDRVTSGDDDEQEPTDGTAASDVESILDLCVARNFPQRMLRWHYRSRHHSLIAVSNREFYDNRLFVVPSPVREGSGCGLEFQFVPDGIFDRGKSRTNRREARLIAQAMIEHARRQGDLSLGVGTFSVAQRDAVLDELELLRREHPETEDFFSGSSVEPWFVKNLENIQGDERDVILISVGYGKDESGFFAMNLGPLTAKGGERRLNVLISRARQRCVVFSSIRADAIDLRRTTSRGAEALKSFLQYAETGRIEVAHPTDRECDSEFEAQVADAVRELGFEVDHQVGVAGFFIDLAVIDPKSPGRYLLGIECDGATYHSARWARDRDRLRQAVLEDQGWTLHRIWSTDWFLSRAEQLRKLLQTIEDVRLLSSSQQSQESHNETESAPTTTFRQRSDDAGPHSETAPEIAREEPVDDVDLELTAPPYVEASFTDPRTTIEVHDLKPAELAEVACRIVQVEGPIHKDEIARRVTTLWGLQRTGSRITKAVSAALKSAERRNLLVESAGFYHVPGHSKFPIRNREKATSSSLRKPEMLPPQEIETAAFSFIRDHISASSDETVRAVARLFGFRSTSQQLRNQIESRIQFLVSTGQLIQHENTLRPSE